MPCTIPFIFRTAACCFAVKVTGVPASSLDVAGGDGGLAEPLGNREADEEGDEENSEEEQAKALCSAHAAARCGRWGGVGGRLAGAPGDSCRMPT